MRPSELEELKSLAESVDRLLDACPRIARTVIAAGRRPHSRWWQRASDWERLAEQLLQVLRKSAQAARRAKRGDVSLAIVEIERRCSQAYAVCRRCHRFNYQRFRQGLPFLCRLESPPSASPHWWLDEQGRVHHDS